MSHIFLLKMKQDGGKLASDVLCEVYAEMILLFLTGKSTKVP